MSKVVTAEYAASLVKDNMTLLVGGFVGSAVPEELLIALKNQYEEKNTPKDLTLFHCAAVGDGGERGANHLGREGLIETLICGHIGLEPRLNELVVGEKIAAFMIPQGVTAHMLRAMAGGKPGALTHVGLKTYADPRLEGCKVNQKAIDSGIEVVSLVDIEDENYLLYKSFPLDVAFIKGTYGDSKGNISLEKEAAFVDQIEMAMATKNTGGIVIAQVEELVKDNSRKAQDVKVPGFLVDYVVVGKPENNLQVWTHEENRPELSGEVKIPMSDLEPMALTERKVCARRGAMELEKNKLINLGIGVPQGVATVASEEGFLDDITLSVEVGVIGGMPLDGVAMGASINPEAIINQSNMFDCYDGGGIGVTFLGAAEIDKNGNVNVSKFGPRVVGPGGFINISQNAKKVCFTGTMTAGGLKVSVGEGKLNIDNEGSVKKFKEEVEQVTFSGEYAIETGQEVLYITERAVFKLTKDGIMLMEVAPGVDIQKDVLDQMEFEPLMADEVKVMDERIFKEAKMGLEI